MLKIAASGIIGVVLACLVFLINNIYISKIGSNENYRTSSDVSQIKSDFISIPVFKNSRVLGYISFKISFNSQAVENSDILISQVVDYIYRNPDFIKSDLDYERQSALSVKIITKNINENLFKGIKEYKTLNFSIVDFAYDKRLRSSENITKG